MYEWNAEFHDRDRRIYPAQIQHLHSPADYEGPRIFCVEDHDEYGKPQLRQVLFRATNGRYFNCVNDPDSNRIAWQPGSVEIDGLNGHWYRCIFILPQIGFNEAGSQSEQFPELQYVKVPVVDLMVDFTALNGKTRINHVGNARHIGDALQGAGITRIPYYVAKEPAKAQEPETPVATDERKPKKRKKDSVPAPVESQAPYSD